MNTEQQFRDDLARTVAIRVDDYAATHRFADRDPPSGALAGAATIGADEPARTLRRWGFHCHECELIFEPLARSLEIASLAYMGQDDDDSDVVAHRDLLSKLLAGGPRSLQHRAAFADFAATVLLDDPDDLLHTEVALSQALIVCRERPDLATSFGRLMVETFGYPGSLQARARVARLRSDLSAEIARQVPTWRRFDACLSLAGRFDALLGAAPVSTDGLTAALDDYLAWCSEPAGPTECTDTDPSCRLDSCDVALQELAADVAMLVGDMHAARFVYSHIRPNDRAGQRALAALEAIS